VIHSRKIDTMDPKLLTEFGKREAMSHQDNHTNKTDTTHTRARYKYSEDLAMVICTYLRKGCTIEAACQAANIGRSTYYTWLDEIPQFKEFVNATESDVEANLLDQIANYGDWRAAAWILERRYPQRWGQKRELDVNVTKQTGVDVVAGMLNHIIKKESTDQQKEN